MNNRIMGVAADPGMGHVKRLLPVAKQLEQDGYELHLCLSRRNCELARAEGFYNLYVLPEITWVENQYGVDIKKSLYNAIRYLAPISQYTYLRLYAQTIEPELIVSDGSVPALRGSNRWEIPSVFITNVIRPQYPFYLQIPFKLPQYFAERYMKKAKKILIADLPFDKAISAYNLGNPYSFNNLEFVGPFIDMKPPVGIKDKKFIYFMPGGTPENKERFRIKGTPLLDKYCKKNDYTWKMSGGRGSGLLEKTELHEIYGYVDVDKRDKFQRECSLMMHNANLLTGFEAIKNLKPSLAIPTKNQPEQKGNARRVQDFGLGVYLREKEFERDLIPSIELIIDNRDYFSKNLREFGAYAEMYDGVGRTVDIIESLV